MKKMRKILAMLLALTMVLGMSLTSMAAPSGNVTVTGTGEAATVKYAQIVEEDRESTLGWKFVDTTVENAFISAFKGEETNYTKDDAIEDLIALGYLENVNANVISGTVNSSEELGKALTTLKDYPVTVATGGVFSPSNIGLYLVVAEETGYTYIPMAVYVATNFTGVKVQAKGSEDKVTKTVATGGESVSEGDKISYTVNAEYPYYSAEAENPTFKIKDTLSNATFETDYALVVKIDNVEVGSGYTAVVSDDNTVLTITFEYDSQYAGKEVEITYVATVGEVDSSKPLSNDVSSEIETGSTTSKVVSDSVDFKVIKTNEEGVKLSGAKFTLYVEVAEADAKDDGKIKDGFAELIVATDSTAAVYGKVVETKETTGAAGEATFTGLDAQKTYYVKETEAPEGYSLNATVYKLAGAIAQDPTTTTSEDGKTIITTYTFTDFNSQTVVDTKLNALPSTGGIGTTIFTVAGCGIMIAAAFFFFASRKRENN